MDAALRLDLDETRTSRAALFFLLFFPPRGSFSRADFDEFDDFGRSGGVGHRQACTYLSRRDK
jgi:hypothetical protein